MNDDEDAVVGDLLQQVLGERLGRHPGVHGVELGVAASHLGHARGDQAAACELQLIVMHIADICDVVANEGSELALEGQRLL